MRIKKSQGVAVAFYPQMNAEATPLVRAAMVCTHTIYTSILLRERWK
ncbi:hypothetical protein HanRHA438_Chr14g0643991 [Helianthus annuus]|uniref:Uncharacterized protein n=2 Tax=Helianthus annuus TaxID=4232 RepID=A0A9K3E7W0_HELAN|nr:hypothetical protein HanXRQr2_Chr14g0633051 [Helianthus annuus]KAJ0839466.1 hypothetical protein HanPSC8_Chr14g0607161 [Helianthus annuus]KAJ0852813.1 hypothetical protein HanRHA438_Chr14g0643991 [Helianthus annuus]